MAHISDNVVENDNSQIEVPGEALQLLCVSVHELGPLDVVNLPILLDEVLADGVDVVDDHEFDFLLVDASSQVDKELAVVVNAIHVRQVDALSDLSLAHWDCLLLCHLGLRRGLHQKVV